jgi:hypothetical protein
MLGEKPEEWRKVDNDFDSFMTTIIKEKGEEYWLSL